MTPFELSILIHYYGCANDFRDGDFSAPALRDTIYDFVDNKMLLEPTSDKNTTTRNPEYRLTDRGQVFVEALCRMPLPEQIWIIPNK